MSCTHEPLWSLRLLGADPPLYWSSTLGWALPSEGPDVFTRSERMSLGQARGDETNPGEAWVCALCGQGDPESEGHVCR